MTLNIIIAIIIVTVCYNLLLKPVLLDEYNDQSRSLGALTALGRTDWAKIRSDHLMSGVNKRSLDALESAIFHVNFLFLALHFGSYFRVG